jgi:hypothetical protein
LTNNETSKKVRSWSPEISSGDESIGNTSSSSGGHTADLSATDKKVFFSTGGNDERAGVHAANRRPGGSGSGSGTQNSDNSSVSSPYKRKRESQARDLRIDGQIDSNASNSALWEAEDSFVMITKSPRINTAKGNDAINPTVNNKNRNIARPSILSRAKSCSAAPNRFSETAEHPAFDDGATKRFDTPSAQSRSAQSNDGLLSSAPRRAVTIRSASPNTLNVATALSLLCGLGGSASPTNNAVGDTESSDMQSVAVARKPSQSPSTIDGSRVSSGIASLIKSESADSCISECDYNKSLFSSQLLASSQIMTTLPPLRSVSKSSDGSENCNSSSKFDSTGRRPHAGSLDATSEEELSVASPHVPSSNDSTFTSYNKRAPIFMIIDPLHVPEDM